jgi:hypothetical protein
VEPETKERCRELCKRAEKEQDPAKLRALVDEIDRLLDEKESHFEAKKSAY